MTEVTIGLPDDVRAELEAQAARCGRSLEEYLADELKYLAHQPASDDWLDEMRAQAEEFGGDLSIEGLLADKDADRR